MNGAAVGQKNGRGTALFFFIAKAGPLSRRKGNGKQPVLLIIGKSECTAFGIRKSAQSACFIKAGSNFLSQLCGSCFPHRYAMLFFLIRKMWKKWLTEILRKRLGSKIVQIKVLMPPEDCIRRKTPTGKAVRDNLLWHNFGYRHSTFYATNMILPILLYFLYCFSLDSVNG